MLLSVHGASFRPVAQARNRVSSLCSPPFPPPAPLPWIAALAALWSAWQPSPLTCLLRKHQTQLAKCQSGVFSPLLPHPQPGALPSSPHFPHPWPIATPQSLSPQPTRLLVLSVRPGQWCGHQCGAVPPATHPGGLQGGGVLVDRTGCPGWGHLHAAHRT